MVFESNSDDLGRDVDESMRMFEKSKVGNADSLRMIEPSRVLLVLDGSNQDVTGRQAAQYLRERFNTETLVLDAQTVEAGTETTATIAVEAAAEISGARPLQRSEDEPYEKILAACQQHQFDLVILPCPFGRSFDDVGTDSAGTVIDVLLSRCPVPMLVIRRDDQLLSLAVCTIAVIVGGECDAEAKAASWAFGLADKESAVTLNLVVEREQFQNIRSIVEALSPGTSINESELQAALAKTHQALHAAMANTAAAKGCEYNLVPQAGEEAPPNLAAETRNMLLVLPLEVDDRFGQGFVQDRIRRSPHPVLVVPSHVVVNE